MSRRSLAGQAALAALATVLMGAVAAHAKDCVGATPLPADVTITPPATNISADLARLSGAWGGAWTPRGGGDTRPLYRPAAGRPL